MNRAAAAAAFLGALLPACGGPQEYTLLETPFGAVQAPDAGAARRVAGTVAVLLPELRRRLPGAAAGPLRVEVQGDRLSPAPGRLAPPQVLGKHLAEGPGPGRILLVRDWEPEILAHELVHALLGPGWEALPPALEEGLADALALEVLAGPWPEQAEVILARRRRWLDRALAADLDAAAVLALPPETLRGHSSLEEEARVLGLLLAWELEAAPGGLTRLYAECQEAAGDPQALAATLAGRLGDSWRDQAGRLLRGR